MVYDAVFKIKFIEEKYFEGKKIFNVLVCYSNSVKFYFNFELK